MGGVESDVANAGGGNGGRGKTSDGTGREGGREEEAYANTQQMANHKTNGRCRMRRWIKL